MGGDMLGGPHDNHALPMSPLKIPIINLIQYVHKSTSLSAVINLQNNNNSLIFYILLFHILSKYSIQL